MAKTYVGQISIEELHALAAIGGALHIKWAGFTKGFVVESIEIGSCDATINVDYCVDESWDGNLRNYRKKFSFEDFAEEWNALFGGVKVTLRNGALCFS